MAKRFTEYRLTLARERTLTVAEPVPEIRNADAAEKVVNAWFEAREPFGESVILIGVDGRNRLIGVVEVSRGGAHLAGPPNLDAHGRIPLVPAVTPCHPN